MSTWTIFWEAAKETPRLYFAPIQAMLAATRDVQQEMVKTQSRVIRAKTIDRASKKQLTRTK
ncbi:hypothetical protein [Cupriavidus gilardii]|uniref:hypothetical protein n=1 Tax=Cupriavidus gilardii TaxID=82541 RepID=UPI001574D6FF|nr:hypothetical protein [Cupriavidus gilardii]NSX05057.1 hypothetical protein [Cupriavidus gilardii]